MRCACSVFKKPFSIRNVYVYVCVIVSQPLFVVVVQPRLQNSIIIISKFEPISVVRCSFAYKKGRHSVRLLQCTFSPRSYKKQSILFFLFVSQLFSSFTFLFVGALFDPVLLDRNHVICPTLVLSVTLNFHLFIQKWRPIVPVGPACCSWSC